MSDEVCTHLGSKVPHSGEEGCSGDKKLIIDMSYIFEKVMKNAIQIH